MQVMYKLYRKIHFNKTKKDFDKFLFVLIAIVMLQCLFMVYWVNQKQIYHIDELFSYRSASILYGDKDYTIHWYDRSSVENAYTSHQQFMDYLTVDKDDSFFKQPLTSIIRSLIKSRPFTVIFNIILSFFYSGKFSKWPSFFLNIFLFCLVQLVYYKIIMLLYGNKKIAALILGVYGISYGAIESVIYIRQYEIFILFSLLYTLLMMKIISNTEIKTGSILLSLVLVWYGFLNAEYMIIYAALFSLSLIIICIKEKNWGKLIKFTYIYFLAGLLFFKLYFSNIISAINTQSETNQLWTLINNHILHFSLDATKESITKYFEIVKEYAALRILGLGAGIMGIVFLLKNNKISYCIQHRKIVFSLLISSIGSVILIGWIAPWAEWRYVSNLYPIFILLLSILFFGIVLSQKISMICLSICFLIELLSVYRNGNETMFVLNAGVTESQAERVHECVEDYDIIYMDTYRTYQRPALFQSAFMWPESNNVFITSPDTFLDNLDKAKSTLDQDTIIVWVATQDIWKNSVLGLIETCGYTEFECLEVFDGSHYCEKYALYLCHK